MFLTWRVNNTKYDTSYVGLLCFVRSCITSQKAWILNMITSFSSEFPKRKVGVGTWALERERYPSRGVFQLVFIVTTICCDDPLCAGLFHQGGVLERVYHIRTERNPKANVLDHFFGVLCLPGVLKICKHFLVKNSLFKQQIIEKGINSPTSRSALGSVRR